MERQLGSHNQALVAFLAQLVAHPGIRRSPTIPALCQIELRVTRPTTQEDPIVQIPPGRFPHATNVVGGVELAILASAHPTGEVVPPPDGRRPEIVFVAKLACLRREPTHGASRCCLYIAVRYEVHARSPCCS